MTQWTEKELADLRDLAAALDAMEHKELVANEFVTQEGAVCALGCLGLVRGVERDVLARLGEEPCTHDTAATLGLTDRMAAMVEGENDDNDGQETRMQRHKRVRAWVKEQLS